MATGSGKRETIKAEAIRLFAERGVDAVSVRDIAAVCDMKAPNLYAHFPSKEALVGELFREGYAEYGDALARAAGEGPFRARLDRIVRAICRLHDRDGHRFRFLLMTQHGFLRDVPRDLRNPVEVICRTVAHAMAEGEIPKRDPALVAAAIVGVVIQPATFIAYGRLSGSLSSKAAELVDMCGRVSA